jgi:1-acyl-sn-glycerol-3-phosphate acyltransferase
LAFKPSPILFWLSTALFRALSWPLFRPRVIPGRTYPPGAFIGVFNHSSNLDMVAMAWAVHKPCSFWAKAELAKVPVFGAWVRRGGAVFVKRGQRDTGAFDEAADRLRAGLPFFLAPEGTRRHRADGSARAHTGFIRLAQLTGVPIVPIALLGTREAMPPDAVLPRPGRITLRIGEPIYLEPIEVDLEHQDELQQQADSVMVEVYRLKEETESGGQL